MALDINKIKKAQGGNIDNFVNTGKSEPEQKAINAGDANAFLSLAATEPKNIEKQAKIAKKLKLDLIRKTFIMERAFVNKVEAYSYYERLTQKDVVEAALNMYFAGKEDVLKKAKSMFEKKSKTD